MFSSETASLRCFGDPQQPVAASLRGQGSNYSLTFRMHLHTYSGRVRGPSETPPRHWQLRGPYRIHRLAQGRWPAKLVG